MARVKPWDQNFERVLTDFQSHSSPFMSLQAFSVVDVFSECILFEVIEHSGCQMSLLKCLVSTSVDLWVFSQCPRPWMPFLM